MGVRYEQEERQWGLDGDRGFTGVDGSRDARLLEQGLCSDAENMDFGEGVARTRQGVAGCAWGRGQACPFPWRFLERWPMVADGTETVEGGIDFATAAGLGTLSGVGIYSDPYGAEALLMAAGERVWRLMAGNEPQTIACPVAVPDGVRLVQAFEKVLMFGGDGFEPQVWDPAQDFGTGLGAFGPISRVSSSNPNAEALPEGHYAVESGGRLWVAYGRDRLAVSEVYDYTNYDPVWGDFRLNEGSDDQVVAVVPYAGARLGVLFNESVWMIEGASGDLGNMQASIVTDRYGCVGPDAWTRVGAELWMLAHDGVRRVAMGDDGGARAGMGTVSEPVAHILERVNWAAADVAQLSTFGRRVYVAVPLDGSTVADGLLVYDLDRESWQGLWTSDAVDFARLVVAGHGGRRRQLAVDSSGVVCVVGEGQADSPLGTDSEIAASMRTRMYAGAGGERLHSCVVDVDLETWGEPVHRVQVHGDGPGELSAPTGDEQPERERYVAFAKAAETYDVTNVAGGHADAGREDYSVPVPQVVEADTAGAEWGPLYPEALSVAAKVEGTPYHGSADHAMIGGWPVGTAESIALGWNDTLKYSTSVRECTVLGYGWDETALNGVPLVVVCAGYGPSTLQEWVIVELPSGVVLPGDYPAAVWQTRTGPVELHWPWHGEGCELHLQARRQRRVRIRRAGAGVEVAVSADGGSIGVMGVSVAAQPGRKDYRGRW